MKTTYIEYDEKGNVKSKCITEYEDSDFTTLTDDYKCNCRPCQDEEELRPLTTAECCALALYNNDLIDDVDDPVVYAFLDDFADLIVENFGDENSESEKA